MKIETMSYNDLAAELDMMLRVLEKIRNLNSMGKTLIIAEEINKILEAYGRN